MPRVANVLLVHYTIIIGPGCFCVAEVRFVTLGFILVVQIKVCLHYIGIILLFSKRKICLILVSFLTIG
jgi:hypothetical protein